ncbi:hypothetical protein [Catenulispora pinisilvae]|uniref:hypothetical protein n=1 Tax=Catenulispora pinisilvae TaxID=2705253 RepID=UPI0018918491|nr:hypothetical protein [Catenulispora pinisilvae]
MQDGLGIEGFGIWHARSLPCRPALFLEILAALARDLENRATVVQFARDAGPHDGADEPARRDLLLGASAASLQLGPAADSSDGAYAVAVGEALWRSVRGHRAVEVERLLARV